MRKASRCLAKYWNTPWHHTKSLKLFSSIISFRITENLLDTKQMFLSNIFTWLFFKWLLSTDVPVYIYTSHLLVLLFLCKQQIALLMPFWSKEGEQLKNEAGSEVRLFFVFLLITFSCSSDDCCQCQLRTGFGSLPFFSVAQCSTNHFRVPSS